MKKHLAYGVLLAAILKPSFGCSSLARKETASLTYCCAHYSTSQCSSFPSQVGGSAQLRIIDQNEKLFIEKY